MNLFDFKRSKQFRAISYILIYSSLFFVAYDIFNKNIFKAMFDGCFGLMMLILYLNFRKDE